VPVLTLICFNIQTGVYLANRNTLEQVIKPSGIDHLDILMAGPKTGHGTRDTRLKIGTRDTFVRS